MAKAFKAFIEGKGLTSDTISLCLQVRLIKGYLQKEGFHKGQKDANSKENMNGAPVGQEYLILRNTNMYIPDP